MNSTSQSSGFDSGPNAIDGKTLLVTLAASTALALAFVLILYVALGGNPSARLGYGLLVSLLPALGTYLVLKLTNIFVSWRGAVFIYFALFVLFLFIQAFGRLISV